MELADFKRKTSEGKMQTEIKRGERSAARGTRLARDWLCLKKEKNKIRMKEDVKGILRRRKREII